MNLLETAEVRQEWLQHPSARVCSPLGINNKETLHDRGLGADMSRAKSNKVRGLMWGAIPMWKARVNVKERIRKALLRVNKNRDEESLLKQMVQQSAGGGKGLAYFTKKLEQVQTTIASTTGNIALWERELEKMDDMRNGQSG